MARRRRSLLGKKGAPATGIPAAKREVAPPKPAPAPPPVEEDEVSPPVADASAPEAPQEPFPEDDPTEASSGEQASADPVPAPQIGDQAEPTEEVEAAPARGGVDPIDVDTVQEEDEAVEEDDGPLIGADLTIPPPVEGEDQAAPPKEVVAHLHTKPPVGEAAASSEPPSDADLVIFDERPDDVVPADQPVVESDSPHGDEPLTPAPAPSRPVPAPTPAGAEVPEPRVAVRGDTGFSPEERDFFSHEDGDPPTEEAPAGVLAEDFAALYSAPTDVPDAPPMPEILGADTPAPAAGGYRPVRAPSAPPAPAAPRGLWDETPHPNAGRPPEDEDAAPPPSRNPPGPTPAPPMFRQREPAADADLPFWKDTWFLVAAAFAAFAAVAVLIGGIMFIGPLAGQSGGSTPVPSRNAPPAPNVDPPPVDLVPVEPVTAPPVEDPAPEASPLVEPLTPADAAPATPRLSTPPRADVTPPADGEPVARTGRLKIRAARKTLIYVNGTPVGLTPLDLDKESGKYEISAEVDGQKRTERVDLAAGTIRLVEF